MLRYSTGVVRQLTRYLHKGHTYELGCPHTEGSRDSWLQVARDAVVVEADAIKNRDVVYQQLSHALPSSANIAAEAHCDVPAQECCQLAACAWCSSTGSCAVYAMVHTAAG